MSNSRHLEPEDHLGNSQWWTPQQVYFPIGHQTKTFVYSPTYKDKVQKL